LRSFCEFNAEAINLDGRVNNDGGKRQTGNVPSDQTGERPVSGAILDAMTSTKNRVHYGIRD
jgi:hypothetical protein